ncbi:MATE family efflux transporter [Mucilaginibacter xinganensis]|uniref:Multidrug-efflux transporter n=1 Tax=Mucilaginibacter xinganensis TaxID=1234841 RepID=A0A223NY61_9SPHI|nr:MATE family efflux transporter [Mucilaginibacter xinganensis]ASU34644.1 Multidrug resistance protein NorM [Mucilaginibacter xinganensis]
MTIYQKYKNHYRDNLHLAIPVVISQVGHTLVQTSDSIIVGHFAGTVSLAAVSLANSVFIIVLVIGIGISYGSTPLIAQLNGRNDYDECGKLLSNSLFLNVVTGIVLFLLTILASTLVLGHLDQTPEVARQARPFLILLGLSIIPMLIFNTFKQFAEGLGFTKQAMLISIWGNLLNICLGITFVKGFFGITPMGIQGVGYSTLIDRCVMAIVMGVYLFKSARFEKYIKSFVLSRISRSRCFQILKIGAPVALQYTFEIGAFSGAAILIGTIGYNEQAAHQVAINLASITYMMSSGLSAAAAIKSGNHFGAKEHENLRYSAISSYHIVLVFMFATACVFMLGNHILPWMYTSDKIVISIAAQLLIIAALFQLFDGTQVVGLGILRGMGDVNIPTVITFIAYWVIGLPVGYILGIIFHLGVNGIWYGLTLGLMTSAILLFFRFQYISRKHRQDKAILIIAQD